MFDVSLMAEIDCLCERRELSKIDPFQEPIGSEI